jgi:hypothetical protein
MRWAEFEIATARRLRAEGFTGTEIAAKLGRSRARTYDYVRDVEPDMRRRCHLCGEVFVAHLAQELYCSPAHRSKAHVMGYAHPPRGPRPVDRL